MTLLNNYEVRKDIGYRFKKNSAHVSGVYMA